MSTRARVNKAGPLPEWKVGDFLLLRGEQWREGSEIYVARVDPQERVEIMWIMSHSDVKCDFKYAAMGADSAWRVEVIGKFGEGDAIPKER